MQPLDHLTPPRTLVRNALLSTPSSRVAFLPIIQQETIYNSSNRSFQPSAEVDLKSILGFIEDSFPVLQRCSPRYVATWADSSNADSKVILIHGRIADALLLASASGPQSISALAIQFLVVVNVVHQLAHAMRTRFDCQTRSTLDSTHSPYYVDDGVSRTYPEAGFLVEDKLFGGVVGVVFKNETRGDRPPFFELDFTEIDYFFLLRQNESGNEAAYRIDLTDIIEWLRKGQLKPFDIHKLTALIPVPREPRLRTCAMLNSTHLPRYPVGSEVIDPDEEQGETGIPPPPEVSIPIVINRNKCGTHAEYERKHNYS